MSFEKSGMVFQNILEERRNRSKDPAETTRAASLCVLRQHIPELVLFPAHNAKNMQSSHLYGTTICNRDEPLPVSPKKPYRSLHARVSSYLGIAGRARSRIIIKTPDYTVTSRS